MEDRDPVKFNEVVDWIENEYNCAETAKLLRDSPDIKIVGGTDVGFVDKHQLFNSLSGHSQTIEVYIHINNDAKQLIDQEAIKAGLRHIHGYSVEDEIKIIFKEV